MTRNFFPGSWYADATPAGSFVVFTPQVGFLTHLGPVALPPGEPWGAAYVRCTDVGGFRFAGQAHSTINPACWEYNGGWVSYPQPCYGVNPCLYALDGVLLRADMSVGSQGFRYAWPNGTPGGQIFTGDQTYGPWNGLSQYSQAAADLWVGQGMTDGSGVLVYDGAILRQLEAGTTTFVRVQVAGEAVAISFTKPDGCVIYQLTAAELRALPPYQASSPSPDPGSPIPEPPKPEPHMDSQRLPDDVYDVVTQLHARNLALAQGSDDDRRALQQKICETVRARKGDRWGWKSNHGIGLANAKDAIAKLPDGATFTPNQRQPLVIWDLFSGSTRAPYPQPVMSINDGTENQFFVPVQPIDHLADVTPPPPQNPPPTKPPIDMTVILALNERCDSIDTQLEELTALVRSLLDKPGAAVTFPKYSGTAKLGTTMRFTMEPQP